MSYSLVVVGGTGQWFLLELCMRQAVEFPTNVWIIDRDFNPHEERGQLAYVLAQKYREATGNEVGTRVFKPCVPDENSNYLYKLIDDLGGENGRVFNTALSSFERYTTVDEGFYGLPRLGVSWVSLQGFSSRLDFLREQHTDPIVVVGSVAGGTGAGLLPYFLGKLRDRNPSDWNSELIVCALTPWFNPQRNDGTTIRVGWRDTCRSARHGINALFSNMTRIKDQIEVQGREDPNIKRTMLVTVGPRIEEAMNTPPYSPRERAEGRSPAPVIRYLADWLPSFLRPADAYSREQKCLTVTIPVIRVQDGSDVASRGEYVASSKAKALADLPFEQALRMPIRINRLSGFGKVLGGDVLLSAATAPFELQTKFIKQLKDAFKEKGQSAQTPYHGAARMIIRNIDEQVEKEEGEKRKYLRDLSRLEPRDENADDDRGRQVANTIYEILKRHAEAELGGQVAAGTNAQAAGGIRVGAGHVPFLPVDGGLVCTSGETPVVISNLDDFRGRLKKTLSGRRYGDDANKVISRSRGSALSLAHVLQEKAEEWGNEDAATSETMKQVVYLWRAAVLGMLYYQPAPEHVRDILLISERNFEKDFKDLRVVYWRNDKANPVGFTSSSVGFVPACDFVESDLEGNLDGNEPGAPAYQSAMELRDQFNEAVEMESSKKQGVDKFLLRAFASSVSVTTHEEPAWHKLLTTIGLPNERPGGIPNGDTELLDSYAKGVVLPLRLGSAPQEEPSTRPLPFAVSQASLDRIWSALQRNVERVLFVQKQNQDGTVKQVFFAPLSQWVTGAEQKLALGYSEVGGTRYIHEISDGLQDALDTLGSEPV
ncbi:hypothetical protein KBB45_04470 [Myxococcota bacterium]|jgi:hypothetical protein|nr:hypothetical protein [Myxococcota bacterium]MBP8970618.1 hypothetical protein [Myxococcota bacterium]HHW97384.1 hypothetical protein [Oligoflexales bacterium]